MERNDSLSYVTNALKITKTFLNTYGSDPEVEELLLTLREILDLDVSELAPINPGSKLWLLELIKLLDKELTKLQNEPSISLIQTDLLTEAANKLILLMEKKSEELNNQFTEQIVQVYEQQRDEAKQWLRFTFVAAALGFLIIVTGIVFILFLARGIDSGSITAGVVTSISGVIINVISTLFLRQSNNANKQANSTLEKLDLYERFRLSVKILSSFKTNAKSHSESSL